MTKLRAIPAVMILAALGLLAPDGAGAAPLGVAAPSDSVSAPQIPDGETVANAKAAAAQGVALAGNAGCTNASLSITINAVNAGWQFGRATNVEGDVLQEFSAPLSSYTFNGTATFGQPISPAQSAGTIIGSYVFVGETPPLPSDTAEFFVLYRCGTPNTVLYSCFGPHGTCPQSAASAVASAAEIRVGGIADSRFSTTYGIDGPSMTSTVDKLENPANFSGIGTVARTVVIESTAATITEEVLSEHDVFFIPWLDDANANAFTTTELNEFEAWVSGGGTLIMTCDDPAHDTSCAHFAHPVLENIANPHSPTTEGTKHPLFNGPFGADANMNMSGNQGYFTATSGADILARNAASQPTVIERKLGAGRLILLGDVDFISNSRLSVGDAITNNNDRFLANLFAYASPIQTTANDFNADGEGDILWRNLTTGNTVAWLVDDFVKTDSQVIGGVPAVWDMAGTGDFNRDGRADILWRNTLDGSNIVWLMDGFTRTAGAIPSVPVVWEVDSIKDYDGDGAADILFRNTSNGLTVAWQMNGFIKQSSNTLGKPPVSFQVEE